MAVVQKFLLGSQTTLMSTELNSLANNGTAISSSAFNNTIGSTGDGYTLCDVELVVSFGANPTANTGISVWFLETQDGSNYEDGDASTTPARLPDVVFPLRGGLSTTQRIIRRVMMPWGVFKTLAKNDGTGQTMASTSNTLKIRPVTQELI